jgi:ribosomal protein S18 acetylase RimI-like enzyme
MTTTIYPARTAEAHNYIVRRLRVGDAPAVRNVAEVTWEATYGATVLRSNRARLVANSYSDDALQKISRRNNRSHWFQVADAGTADAPIIIGFAEALLRPGTRPDAELTRIYVLPGWQRRGVGQTLLDTLLIDLRSLERHLIPPRLYLSVAAHNAAAIRFYEARGFRYNRSYQANLPGQFLDMKEYFLEL